jgi:predicted O-methyltransferase YrrM
MRWQEIYNRLPKDRPIVGAEIGVWTGKTSSFLLENMPNLTLYMIDAWTEASNIPSFLASRAKMTKYPQKVYDDAYKTVCEIASKHPSRSFVIKEESVVYSKRFPVSFFDFIFIDGDHSYEGVSKDIDAWYPLIKSSGILCGHDYGRGFKGVKQAVDERFKESEIELGDDTTYFIRKP